MVCFVSLVFILITFHWVSMLKFVSRTKLSKNTEEASFGITEETTEAKNDLKVEPIVESKIFSVGNRPVLLCLSYSVTLTNQSYSDN